MRFLYDSEKDIQNVKNHGISLDRAKEYDFATALEIPDDSQDYGETRYIAIGFLAGNLYVLIFTLPEDDTTRLISLRRASKAEEKIYAEH